MGRIGRSLFLGAVAVLCGSAPSAAEPPAAEVNLAIVTFGETAAITAPALDEARRALSGSLGGLGARVTGRVIAKAPVTAKIWQAVAAQRSATLAGPIDAVIALSIRPVRRAGTYTAHLEMSVRAELYPVEGRGPARRLSARGRRRLPGQCDSACLSRITTGLAGEQARALAPEIHRWAARIASRAQRRLTFRGFSRRELTEIRQYLRVFSGFQRMGREEARAGDRVIPYRSRLNDRALEAALAKMFGHMGISAGITGRGGSFAVTRRSGPGRAGADSRQW